MITKTSNYLLSRLFIWSFLLGCCTFSLLGQNNVLDSRIDSNCILHVRLLDSTGGAANAHAPYLLQVNQYQRNSNATAIWQVDLSRETTSNYNITVIDANLTRYTDNISSNCAVRPPSSSIQLRPPSTVPTNSCDSCTGRANITIANPSGIPYTFSWSDGVTYIDTSNNTRNNLCAGTYMVVVADSLGNHNSVEVNILCPTNTNITCRPTIKHYLNANGEAFLSPRDVRIGSTFTVDEEYFVDAQNNFSLNYKFDCSNIGYQYLILLAKDSSARYDTCPVLVEIIDSFHYCSASSNTVQISDTSFDASNCSVCNGNYSFDYLVRPTRKDTLNRQDVTLYWSDTTSNTPVRTNLCPNKPYHLTVVDNANNRYKYTITVGCSNNNCITPPSTSSYCPDVFIPVCGCNKITYKNACIAQYEAGVQTWSIGSCAANTLQLNISTFADSSACDSSVISSGSALVQVIGGVGPFSYIWSNGQIGASAYNLRTGNYIVTVTDSSTNLSVSNVVTIGSQGCVWPGDTDNNGAANNFDLLPIGLTYGDSSTTRSSISTAWQGFPSLLWRPITIPFLANRRHIDCNGDGTIDSLDVQAILSNYSLSYARNSNNSLLGTIPFYVESSIGKAGDTVRANIILGDSINPAVNVYGVAFTLNYDPRFLDPTPIQVDFSNSWLGNDLLHVQQDVRRRGQIEIAVTRKNRQPTTGAGAIGSVLFTIKDDIMMGRLTGDSIISPIGISNIRLINEHNRAIGTYTKTGNIVLKENISTKKLSTAGIFIFPNPTQDILHIHSKNTSLERLQIFTATGQLVQTIEPDDTHQYTIDTQTFANGLYLIHLQTSKGNFNKKIHILH